jgi:hypothetical protein
VKPGALLGMALALLTVGCGGAAKGMTAAKSGWSNRAERVASGKTATARPPAYDVEM